MIVKHEKSTQPHLVSAQPSPEILNYFSTVLVHLQTHLPILWVTCDHQLTFGRIITLALHLVQECMKKGAMKPWNIFVRNRCTMTLDFTLLSSGSKGRQET